MFVTNWISTTKIQKISEITNFFRHYFLSRTEVRYLNSYKVIVAGGRDYIYNYKGTWTNHGGYHERHEGLPLPIGASWASSQ